MSYNIRSNRVHAALCLLKARNLLHFLLRAEDTIERAQVIGRELAPYRVDGDRFARKFGVEEYYEGRVGIYARNGPSSAHVRPTNHKGLLSHNCACGSGCCVHVLVIAFWGLRDVMRSQSLFYSKLPPVEQAKWARVKLLHTHLESGHAAGRRRS